MVDVNRVPDAFDLTFCPLEPAAIWKLTSPIVLPHGNWLSESKTVSGTEADVAMTAMQPIDLPSGFL